MHVELGQALLPKAVLYGAEMAGSCSNVPARMCFCWELRPRRGRSTRVQMLISKWPVLGRCGDTQSVAHLVASEGVFCVERESRNRPLAAVLLEG